MTGLSAGAGATWRRIALAVGGELAALAKASDTAAGLLSRRRTYGSVSAKASSDAAAGLLSRRRTYGSVSIGGVPSSNAAGSGAVIVIPGVAARLLSVGWTCASALMSVAVEASAASLSGGNRGGGISGPSDTRASKTEREVGALEVSQLNV